MSQSYPLKENWIGTYGEIVLNQEPFVPMWDRIGVRRRLVPLEPRGLGRRWDLLCHPRAAWQRAQVAVRLEWEPCDPWVGAMVRTSYWGQHHPRRRHLWLQPLPCVALHVWWNL